MSTGHHLPFTMLALGLDQSAYAPSHLHAEADVVHPPMVRPRIESRAMTPCSSKIDNEAASVCGGDEMLGKPQKRAT